MPRNKTRRPRRRHSTRFVGIVTMIDPETGGQVELEIRKDLVTAAMIGLDGSYLAQEVGPVFDPYNRGVELIVPDDEPARGCSAA